MSNGASGAPRPKLIDGVRTGALWIGGGFALLAGLALAAGPLLFRAGALDIDAATRGIQSWAMLFFAIGLVLGLFGLIAALAGRRQRGAIVGVVMMLASGYGLGQLYGQTQIREAVPPLYDVQTDWTDPVAFRASTMEERAANGAVAVSNDARVSGGKWNGQTFAEAQASYYDTKPMIVAVPVDVAASEAADAAERLGWTVTTRDAPGGVVEIVRHEVWYGLASDMAVRIRPEGTGSRLDMRSTSRSAGHDMGANAVAISALQREIEFALAQR